MEDQERLLFFVQKKVLACYRIRRMYNSALDYENSFAYSYIHLHKFVEMDTSCLSFSCFRILNSFYFGGKLSQTKHILSRNKEKMKE